MPRRSSHRQSSQQSEAISLDDVDPDLAAARSQGGSQPDGGFAALREEQQDELVKRFVKYMLARNQRKRPIRRPDLTRHVFSNMDNIRSKQKVFNGTMTRAQNVLRNIYGYEMVAIERAARRSATMRTSASASQSVSAPIKAYILVSTLQAEMRFETPARFSEFAFIIIVACFILLTPGCRISQEDLYRALNRIGVYVKERGGHKQLNDGNVRDLIERELVDQWYFIRDKEDNSFFYALGPRLRAEVNDQDLLQCVEGVYQLGNDETATLDETARMELQSRLNEAAGKTGEMDEDDEEEED